MLSDLLLKNILEELKELKTSQKETLTVDEVSTFLGYEKSYIYKLTSERMIPHSCPTGRKLIFERSEILNWIKENRVPTKEDLNH